MSGLSDAAAVVTAATAAIAVGGSYVQFVLKRLVLPSAEFDVEFTPYVRGSSQLIGEVALVLKNVGSSTLIVTGVRSRIRFRLETDEELQAPKNLAEPLFFYNLASSIADVASTQPSSSQVMPSQAKWFWQVSAPATLVVSGQSRDNAEVQAPEWLTLVQQRTFIQPGVTQYYRKPIGLQASTQLIHVWGAFDYQISIGPVNSFLIRWLASPPKGLDWRKGIKNHTVRRTFFVPDVLLRESSPDSSV